MIACYDAAPPTGRSDVIGDHAETHGAEWDSPSVELSGPRAVEILTVLNDVFDGFGLSDESGVLATAGAV